MRTACAASIILLTLALSVGNGLAAGEDAIEWAATFDDAIWQAKKRHRPIMVFVARPKGVLCRRVWKNTLPAVSRLQQLVCVKLHADEDHDTVQRLPRPDKGYRLPLISITDWNLSDLGFTTGVVPPAKLDAKLKAAIDKLGPRLTAEDIKALEAQLAEAEAANKAGRIHRALVGFSKVADTGGMHPIVRKGRKHRDALLEQGDNRLREAVCNIARKDYYTAALSLGRIARDFAGSKPGAMAREHIRRLKQKRGTAGALSDANRELAAEEALHKAQDLEAAGKPRAALRAYNSLQRRHAGQRATHGITESIRRLEKRVARLERLGTKTAAQQITGLMNVAENLAANGKLDAAVEHYEEVIRLAPDSPAHQQAEDAITRIEARR